MSVGTGKVLVLMCRHCKNPLGHANLPKICQDIRWEGTVKSMLKMQFSYCGCNESKGKIPSTYTEWAEKPPKYPHI